MEICNFLQCVINLVITILMFLQTSQEIKNSQTQLMLLFWVMTNLMHSFLMYLFYASTCFQQQVLIIRRAKLY
jgi:hypothetical protein